MRRDELGPLPPNLLPVLEPGQDGLPRVPRRCNPQIICPYPAVSSTVSSTQEVINIRCTAPRHVFKNYCCTVISSLVRNSTEGRGRHTWARGSPSLCSPGGPIVCQAWDPQVSFPVCPGAGANTRWSDSPEPHGSSVCQGQYLRGKTLQSNKRPTSGLGDWDQRLVPSPDPSVTGCDVQQTPKSHPLSSFRPPPDQTRGKGQGGETHSLA